MGLKNQGPGWEPRVKRAVSALGPTLSLPPEAWALFPRLLDLVVQWNARFGLTAARDPDQLVDLYLGDALVLAGHRAPSEQWVDVGSGGGAPALALAVLAPDLDLTLVEPREKRVAFLRTSIGALGLRRVRVARARSESLEVGGWDVAVSRATLPPEEWLAEGVRLARQVWVLLAQSPPPARSGWHIDCDVTYLWPLTGVERRAVRFVREPS